MSSLLASQAANREYATRPKDERFSSVDALIADALHQKQLSKEVVYNAKDLRAVAVDADDSNPQAGSIMLASPNGRASFTHYSFGQLASTIGAPAKYLRSLPPAVAADCINFGLKHTPPATDLKILAQAANGAAPKIRACTSETYGRVWDADLYSQIKASIIDHGKPGEWIQPPTWGGEPSGLNRGDRDSFMIVVNGGSIVADPSLTTNRIGTGGNGTTNIGGGPEDGMYRGLLVRNSEVGAASIIIEQILFRYICGNHMLWGAVMQKSFSRRHVGKSTLRDTIREIQSIAYRWNQHSPAQDEAIIKALITHEIAASKEAVIDELHKIGFTKAQAKDAYETAEQKEQASPRSFWGIAQGATRNSQESGYQDDRLELDMLAAKVLQRGRLQYA